jgi:hypothetical protein
MHQEQNDGSGVAAMMELAKIMSKRSYPCTHICCNRRRTRIVARHLAEMAKAEKWNIVAMLNNMIGNSLSSGTRLSNNTKVRVFSETIPYLETEDEARCVKYK